MNLIKNLTKEELKQIFKDYPLYSQENVKEPLVILEIFIPNQNIYWLITEGNQEDEDFTMFGYCKIQYGELGYVSFNELLKLGYLLVYNVHTPPISLKAMKAKYN